MTPGYFGTRLAHDPNRAEVWQHLCAYLPRWIPADADVLELGAGWCDFANQVAAAGWWRWTWTPLSRRAAAGTSPRWSATAPTCRGSPDGRFDVVFASNLLEHLDRAPATGCSAEAARVLAREGG